VARSVAVTPADLRPDQPDQGVTVPRRLDVVPVRATPWRLVRVSLAAPPESLVAADGVRDLLDEPELLWSPGLRQGTLAVLPRPGALTRVLLSWEWSVEAAAFTVQSWEPEPFSPAEAAALESWLRATALRLRDAEPAVEAAARRVVDDVAAGHDVSPAAPHDGSLVVVEARIGTAVVAPDARATHPRVDVLLPDPDDPGRESFVDARTGEALGERRTLEAGGEAVAFRYVVAEPVEGAEPQAHAVTVDDLAHWHDQHIQRQMLADDVRQAAVHVLAGIDPPASVAYAIAPR